MTGDKDKSWASAPNQGAIVLTGVHTVKLRMNPPGAKAQNTLILNVAQHMVQTQSSPHWKRWEVEIGFALADSQRIEGTDFYIVQALLCGAAKFLPEDIIE